MYNLIDCSGRKKAFSCFEKKVLDQTAATNVERFSELMKKTTLSDEPKSESETFVYFTKITAAT